MKHSNGFTLIEMIAATVILGILITVVLAPLAQLFRRTSNNGQKLSSTTQAQELVEYIRGQWRPYPVTLGPDPADSTKTIDLNATQAQASRDRYDRTCFDLPAMSDMTAAVTVYALDSNGAQTSTLSPTACPNPLTSLSAPPDVPIKRVTVQVTTANGSSSSLTLDLPRP